MLFVSFFFAQVLIIVLVIYFRSPINDAVGRWYDQNRFFIFVLVSLMLAFAGIDILLFCPPDFCKKAANVLLKLAEWSFGFLP